jgi:cytochrome c-type biogenesis protein CcmH
MIRRTLWLCAILLAFLVPAHAQSISEVRAKALFNELRCVVCAGQSIAESNAELAQDMREQVELLIDDNRSDAEIRDWFVRRYGDAVLMNPPLKPLTFALWFGPVIIFLIGMAVTGLVLLRGRSRLKDKS